MLVDKQLRHGAQPGGGGLVVARVASGAENADELRTGRGRELLGRGQASREEAPRGVDGDGGADGFRLQHAEDKQLE